jgi:hypothetical protein
MVDAVDAVVQEASRKLEGVGEKISELEVEYTRVMVDALVRAVQAACPSFTSVAFPEDPDSNSGRLEMYCPHMDTAHMGDSMYWEQEHGLDAGAIADNIGEGPAAWTMDRDTTPLCISDTDWGYEITREALLSIHAGIDIANTGAQAQLADVAPNTLTPESPEVKMALAMHHNPAGG